MKLHGVGVSPGSAAGPLHVVLPEPSGSSGGASGGIEIVRAAADRASQELLRLAAGVREQNPEGADVLEAQAMLSVDPAVEPDVVAALADGSTPAAAVRRAFETQAATVAELDDPYLAARADDVREAGRCVTAALAGRSAARLDGLREPAIVVAAELATADTLAVDPHLLLG
ncbi:MAG: phosphoenolpyruvate-utilizing N-terminal domain-containing protein, partial [Candidatus Dormiibacterota bacterium]